VSIILLITTHAYNNATTIDVRAYLVKNKDVIENKIMSLNTTK
jgi:hypothetical protein